MRLLTQRDLGWIEGIIDGEGCLTMEKNKYAGCRRGFGWKPKLHVSNTNRAMLDRLSGLLGGSVCGPYKQKKNWKPIYHYDLTSSGLRRILPAVRLTVKERQRLLLLQALSLLRVGHHGQNAANDVSLERIFVALRKLNRKGTD